MTDATKLDAGPEIPQELWAMKHERFGLYGTPSDGGAVVYSSEGDAQASINKTVMSGNWQPILVGVPPRYRDAIEAVDRLVKLTRNCVDFGDFDLDGLAAIVTEAKRGRP